MPGYQRVRPNQWLWPCMSWQPTRPNTGLVSIGWQAHDMLVGRQNPRAPRTRLVYTETDISVPNAPRHVGYVRQVIGGLPDQLSATSRLQFTTRSAVCEIVVRAQGSDG